MAKAKSDRRLTENTGGAPVSDRLDNDRVDDRESPREFEAHEDERDSLEAREMTEADFLQQYRESLHNNVLPELPKIPGYHTFWATTTNPRDSIQRRKTMGYTFLKDEDYPQFGDLSIKSGTYAGVIGMNEMVAMKLPLNLYRAYMNESHHVAPLSEEEKLKRTVEQHSENAKSDKGKILDEDGYMDNVVQKGSSAPRFAA